MLRALRFFLFFSACFLYGAVPVYRAIVHFPEGTEFDAWGGDVGCAWLADKQEGLFVTAHDRPIFGGSFQELGEMLLVPVSGPSIRCRVVYADWINRISLLKVISEDRPLLNKLAPAVISKRLCKKNEEVRVASITNRVPFFVTWKKTHVVDPWILETSTPQEFAVAEEESYVRGAPVLDHHNKILGIIWASSEGMTFVIQGRYIAHVLEKWRSGSKVAPGFFCSWDMEKMALNRRLIGSSKNGMMFVDWGVATLGERAFYGGIDMKALDVRYKRHLGDPIQKEKHLLVRAVHTDILDIENAPRVGDIIWAVWDEEKEEELYGDPLKLVIAVEKAFANKRKSVQWTVLRKTGPVKVSVPIAYGRSASEVLFFGNTVFSNEEVPGNKGIACISKYTKWTPLFVNSIDGVDVHSLQDIYKALKTMNNGVVGVGGVGECNGGRGAVQVPWMPIVRTAHIFFQLWGMFGRPRLFVKTDEGWREQV